METTEIIRRSIPAAQESQQEDVPFRNEELSSANKQELNAATNQEVSQSPYGKLQERLGKLPESPLAKSLRIPVGAALDVGSSFAGTPGDISSLGLGAANFLTGGATPTYAEAREKLPVLPRTSGEIKKDLNEATGGYTEAPENSWEETGRNTLETAANLFLPNKLAPKVAGLLGKVLSPETANNIAKIIFPFSGHETSAKKAVGLALSGEAGKEGIKQLGGDEISQLGGRLLLQTLAGTYGTREQLYNRIEKDYDAARKALEHPQGLYTNVTHAPKLRSKVDELINYWDSNPSPYKDKALEVLNQFKDSVKKVGKGDAYDATDLLKFKRSANEWIKLNEIPKFEGQPYLPGAVRDTVEQVLTETKKALEPIAKNNEKFGKAFGDAEEIFKGFTDLDKTTRFFQEHGNWVDTINSNVAKSGLLLGSIYLGGPKGAALTGSVLKGTKEALLFKNLIKKSPIAKKTYIKSMGAAANNSFNDFKKYANQLSKIAEHYK